MAKASFVNNVNRDTTRNDLDQQFNDRLKQQSSSSTASSAVTTAPAANTNLANAQNVQTTLRLDPNFLRHGDGFHVGRIRTETEDQTNLSDRQKVDIAQVNLARSTIDTSVRAQSSADVTRHRQKNQARCNHLFDSFNGRCLWCNKKKSSQVYDQ